MRGRLTWRRLFLLTGVMWLGVVGFGGTSWAEKPDTAGDKAQASQQGVEHGKAHQDDTVQSVVASADVVVAAASASTANSGEGPGGKFECNEPHHSDTGHGANTSGDFDPNCEPAEAGNGNGDGNQSGQPCAGCVGNADGKNPPGQASDDANNGYECDGNSGIGKTNPAHTRSCATTTPNTPPPQVQVTTTGSPAVAAAAGAEVLGVSFTRPVDQPAAPVAVAALAFTGANVGREVTVAASLLLVGTVMLLVSRRRESDFVRIADRI